MQRKVYLIETNANYYELLLISDAFLRFCFLVCGASQFNATKCLCCQLMFVIFGFWGAKYTLEWPNVFCFFLSLSPALSEKMK